VVVAASAGGVVSVTTIERVPTGTAPEERRGRSTVCFLRSAAVTGPICTAVPDSALEALTNSTLPRAESPSAVAEAATLGRARRARPRIGV
jgi:hypothetical protein